MGVPTYAAPPPRTCARHPPPHETADAAEALAAALASRDWFADDWFADDDAVLEGPTRGWAPRALLPPRACAGHPPPHDTTDATEASAAALAARDWFADDSFADDDAVLEGPTRGWAPRALLPPPAAADPPPPSDPVSVAGTRAGGVPSASRRSAPRVSAPLPPPPAADDPRAAWEDVPRGAPTPRVAPSTPPTAGDAAAPAASAAATGRRPTAPPSSVPAATGTRRQGNRHGRHVHWQDGGRGDGRGDRSRTAAAADAAAPAAAPPVPSVDRSPPLQRRRPSPGNGGGGSTESPPAPEVDRMRSLLSRLPSPGTGPFRPMDARPETDAAGQTVMVGGGMEGGQWRAVVWERDPPGTGGIATIAWGPAAEDD